MAGPVATSSDSPAPVSEEDHYASYIARALATDGGHLVIGAYGFTLWFGRGCRLSGYDGERVGALCLAAGLPIIDTRGVATEVLTRMVMRAPLVAVGEAPDAPPWHGLARAPLAHVTAFYRRAGAVVLNLPSARSAPSRGRGG